MEREALASFIPQPRQDIHDSKRPGSSALTSQCLLSNGMFDGCTDKRTDATYRRTHIGTDLFRLQVCKIG